jgi:hypothetical protein
MNDAQLKMILDAMATMGAAGKDAFIWWLALDKGLPILAWIVFIGAAAAILRLAINWGREYSLFEDLRARAGFDAYTDSRFQKTVRKAMDALGPGA